MTASTELPQQRRPPTVSVVLATYDGASFLPEQLASLRRQDQQPDEVVIVDDGSSDGTVAILEEYQRDAEAHVVLVAPRAHQGTWAAFEEALQRARGDIIVVCDQDDRWDPKKLRLLAQGLERRPDAKMAFSDARLIDADGEVIGRSRWRVAGFAAGNVQLVSLDPFGQLLSHQAVSGCTLAIRSDILRVLLPFPPEIHPALPRMMYDRWISLVASAAGPVVTVSEKLVDYRIHPGQQIGIPALGIRRFAPRFALHAAQFLHSSQERQARIRYHIAHLDEIEKRLDASGLADGEPRARLDAARRHLTVRASLDRSRPRRVRVVIDEYRRLDGYRRFSLGLASAIADVVR